MIRSLASYRLVHLCALTVVALGTGACSDGASTSAPLSVSAPSIVGDVLLNPPSRPAGPRALRQALGPNGHHIIYLNYEGVKLLPNYDDSIHNQSSIVASAVGNAITVPAFDQTDLSNTLSRTQVMSDITALVKTYFAPFNVDIVTARPAQPDYVMVAVGGSPSLINQPCTNNGCVLGIAPLDCQSDNAGNVLYNQQGDVEVVFAFSAATMARNYQGAVNEVAGTIAQETAHAYGLGHSTNTSDVMYPYSTGGSVSFTNTNAGYADSNNCANGRGTQNSFKLLTQILGSSGVDHTPPTITIDMPVNHSQVGRTFTVAVTAQGKNPIDHVDYELSGPENDSTTVAAAPFSWNKSVGTDGTYKLAATATDSVGNQSTTAFIDFDVRGGAPQGFGGACATGTDCQSGVCVGGTCNQSCGTCPSGYTCGASKTCSKSTGGGSDAGTPAPSGGAIGDHCATGPECASGICADSTYCTGQCDPSTAGSCPDPLVCAPSGDPNDPNNYCVYQTSGGCSAGSKSPSSGAAWLVLLALPLLRRRRRA